MTARSLPTVTTPILARCQRLLVSDLGDRGLEGIAEFRQDEAEPAPLGFQGLALVKAEVELKDADDHGR